MVNNDDEDDVYNRRFYNLKSKKISKSIYSNIKEKCSKLQQSLKSRAFYKKIMLERMPILSWLFLGYNFKSNLLNDIVAGFTVGIMNLPQVRLYLLKSSLVH
jgi:hypothetical protein